MMACMQRILQSLRKNQVGIYSNLYWMIDAFLESPDDIEMQGNMPSSPEEYGKRSASLAPAKAKKFDFGMRMQLSPSPVQEDNLRLPKKSDFGILSSLSPFPEPQVDIGTRTPSSMHEGFGNSSENRSEFHITKSHANITEGYAVWKWGGPVPSVIHSKRPTEPSAVEEVEGMGEPVCLYISMLQWLLINACYTGR